MLIIVGFVVVTVCVLGGYVALGGHMGVLMQPFELVIIGGAAVGAYLSANTKTILTGTLKSMGRILKGARHKKSAYVELLSLMLQMFKLARAKGNLALEQHVENPQESEIFNQFPTVLRDNNARTFICDYLRLITMGSDNPHELEALMDEDLDTHHHEETAVSGALTTMADGLPALGIVAAVLGVIKTMGAINEPPEILGGLIGAALVGTFLGILLAYGYVAPLATALANIIDADAKYCQCIKAGILAHVAGQPPAIAVEFARKTLSSDVRPDFYELEKALDDLPPVISGAPA